MSIVSAIFNAGKVTTFEEAFGVKNITSPEMRQAIADWYGLYYANPVQEGEDPCQRIPTAIVAKLYKAVFSEYDAQAEKTGPKGEYISDVLNGLDAARNRAVQQMLIGGQCYLKPIMTAPMTFCVVDRENYIPLARDIAGNIIDIGTMEQTVEGSVVYTLLERRTVDALGYLTIESRLYRSNDKATLGVPVPLGALEKYAELVPVLRLPQPVGSIGLIPLSCPAENCVDGTQDPVSVYAAAVGLIHNINRNESLLNGEFERGQSRVFVSSDLLHKDSSGRRKLDDNLFVGVVDDDPEAVGMTIFSPALRDANFLARKTEYLRNVESLIGLKRGLLSEVETQEKTATEITSSAGEYNLTVIDFQRAWEKAVREAVRVCNVLGQMYGLTSGGAVDPDTDVSISWGNGILYDEDKEWSTLMQMVAAGILKPEIAIAWKYDLPWDKPEDLAAIREKYMPDTEGDANQSED